MSQNGHQAPAAPTGLPVGAPVAGFTLADLEGRPVSLADFDGKQVLLIHWSPTCGFCDLIAPQLAGLQERLSTPKLQALLISYGDVAANRALALRHGLRLPILLLGGQRLAAFDQLGTPVAYLLDGHGKVGRPIAVGADAVVALARESAAGGRKRLPGEKPLTESLLLRDGLEPGTPAPVFRLPDLSGKTVALDAYRGRRVLLVFTDPQCGPCNELTPQLVAAYPAAAKDGPAILMVVRGDLEDNHRKAEEYGITFPVVLQEQWKLSREYGIFATPVAFLIDENGIIERPVAKGKDEIVQLARVAGAREKEPVA